MAWLLVSAGAIILSAWGLWHAVSAVFADASLPAIVKGAITAVGGEIHEYTKLMAESREQSIDRMVAVADTLGANAIVSVRLSTSYIMGNASEILVYGDAVVLETD